MIWLVFGQTLRHEFVNYDDNTYVYENQRVVQGLTLPGLKWALTHPQARNIYWHPLTTISHMLDCQIFGLNAGGHHFTNVFLHTIAALLLFFVLQQMTGGPSSPALRRDESVRSADRTGDVWRSAFVAALFAIHPQRVESVAWIAERKDVLSGVFFMLTLLAYVRYVRRASIGRYLLVMLLFALGLLCKPILVTLPFVLLLLDYWPLGRFGGPGEPRSIARLILEKVPLLFLSAASCVVTLFGTEAVASSKDALSLPLRISNALVACVTYIWQMIWPAKLAAFYPHPYERLPFWQVVLALALLLAVSALAFVLRKRRPYFIVGWLWYLAMLVPVLGIVQVGAQARADRYTYLSHIGLFLLVTWAVADLTPSWRYRRQVLSASAAIVIIALAWSSWIQTSSWRNSESLWTRAIAVTSDNDIAHNNLGLVFQRRGQLDDAISQYRKALGRDVGAGRYTTGIVLSHNNLGTALVEKRLMNEAISHFEKAVTLFPAYVDGHYNLANALFHNGRVDDAIAHWRKTLSLRPDDAEAHTSLAHALFQKGEGGEAIAHYEKAREIAPDSIWVLNDLAWALATSSEASLRNGAKAIQLAEKADQLSLGKNPTIIRTLAAAYAESGRFDQAIEAAHRASQFALAQGDSALADQLNKDISLYRTNSPLGNISRTNAPPSP